MKGQHFIQGQWQAGDGPIMSRQSPLDQQTIWQANILAPVLFKSVLKAVKEAQLHWVATTLANRITVVERFATLLQRDIDELATAIHLENGKPQWEAKTEVEACIKKIAISIKAYESRTGLSNPSPTSQLQHRPHGVFLVLGPYNFPAHLPNGHIVPALLAGNGIVFKPSEFTPLSAEKIVDLWVEAGLDPDLFAMIQGGVETGIALTECDFDGVLFTGSWQTGQKLHRQFAGKPEVMLALEMGGNNPLVVTETQNSKAAVYTILQSAFVSAGQRCTCARRLILVDTQANRLLVANLVKACQQLQLHTTEKPFYGPLISQQAANKLLSTERKLINQGASALLSLQQIDANRPLLSPGIIDVTSLAQREDDEYFGPLLQVIWVKDFAAAILEANNTQFGLAAGLISQDQHQWHDFQLQIKAGVVNWNQSLTGASSAMPFGGVGRSGNYRPSAYYAADYCAWPMSSLASKAPQLPEQLLPGVKL